MAPNRRGSGAVTITLLAIFAVLAVFATIAWIQDSTYGVVAVALWVATIITLLMHRRRARV
jgi:hypothetical protein